MSDLDDLLFLEIERRIDRDEGRIAKPGEPVYLPAKLPAPAPGLACREILDDGVECIRLADDRHFADQFARRGPGGLERQLDVITGDIARQQQIAFGAVAVEHLIFGQFRQIARQFGLGPAGLAARADRRHPGVKHLKPDNSIFDPLGRHLDRGEISLVAQIGRGAVANFADYRYWLVGPGIIVPGAAHLARRRALEIVELDIGQLDPDIGKFGIGQRAR